MTRVLVVDDEPGVRSFLARALRLVRMDTDEAANGEQALLAIRKVSYDVVITDLRMPGIDGMEVLRTIKREQPEVEVIMLTAHGGVESAVEAMRLGAFDYLQKPISSPAELRLVVERAVERRRLVDARQALSGTDLPPLSHGAPAMKPVMRALTKVAPTEATVLLLGESGTGKEVAARTLHALSSRREGPFVAVNCATLSDTMLESELFGHERGAFTGAVARRRGRIELAAGGTFFLDEVGELEIGIQARLLRVLQERTFERVGGDQVLAADVRWIAATNRDLRSLVAEGGFREDLFHRIAVFPVELPPLRERREDLLPLASALLHRVARSVGKPGLTLSVEAEREICSADWPGNVRELANALERAAILTDGDTITAEDLLLLGGPARAASSEPPSDWAPSMEEAEREAIRRALSLTHGNRKEAAVHLGIGLRTLYDKLKRYDLQ